jgi:RNA polymerase sigma-70 factor (ECF subfamily)
VPSRPVSRNVRAAAHDSLRHLDESRFTAFHEKTARPLWSYIRRICGDRALADDLLQEAFLRFCRAPVSRLDPTEMKSYLYKIATNLVAEHWRRSGRRAASLSRPRPQDENVERDVPDARDEEAENIRRRDVDRVFGRLTPRERALLWLAYVEGSAHREMAERLGLRAGSIKVLLFRARQKFALFLRETGLGPERSS